MLDIQYGRRFKKEFQKAVRQEGHTLEMFQTVLVIWFVNSLCLKNITTICCPGIIRAIGNAI